MRIRSAASGFQRGGFLPQERYGAMPIILGSLL
jgi:hypothetical protein